MRAQQPAALASGVNLLNPTPLYRPRPTHPPAVPAIFSLPHSAAAEHLVGLLLAQPGEPRWRGVCFFDEARRAWMVLDLQRRLTPREVSPIREDQALCIYDEARCRGADLRLRPDALGLLTLGPTTYKDKLMQVTPDRRVRLAVCVFLRRCRAAVPCNCGLSGGYNMDVRCCCSFPLCAQTC